MNPTAMRKVAILKAREALLPHEPYLIPHKDYKGEVAWQVKSPIPTELELSYKDTWDYLWHKLWQRVYRLHWVLRHGVGRYIRYTKYVPYRKENYLNVDQA